MKTKKYSRLLIKLLAASLTIILFTMVSDWMALHDVFQDYASSKVINDIIPEHAGSLPLWTTTKLEWKWLEIMFGLRLLLVLGMGYLSFRLYHILESQSTSKPDSHV